MTTRRLLDPDEALRRLDWKGDYISWAHLEAEGALRALLETTHAGHVDGIHIRFW